MDTQEAEEEEDPQEALINRNERRRVFLLESLQNADLRLYIKWRISECIIICQYFLSLYLIIYIYMSYYSGSLYFWAFYGIIPGVHLLSSLMLLFNRGGWSVEDTRTLLYCNCNDMMSALTSRKTNFRYFTTFMSVKILLFFYSVGVFMLPLNQYLDLVEPPTNTSSCTSVYLYSSFNAYNPNGFFDSRFNYSNSLQLKFCPMDQTWAWPNFNTTIQGYLTSPLSTEGVDACANPLTPFPIGNPLYGRINGYADGNICLNPLTGRSRSYPSPVLGLRPPITQGTKLVPVALCNGNTNDNVCINSDGTEAYTTGTCGELHRIGRPRKICPVCLNYWRRMANDFSGPPGYEHCTPYDGTTWNNPFCAFCPGRGYGWLAGVVYTKLQLLWNLVLSAVLIFLLLVEYFVCLTFIAFYIPEIRNVID